METADLDLILATADHFQKLIDGPAAFEATYGLPVMAGYLEFEGVLAYMLDEVKGMDTPSVWGTYLFIHRADHVLMGLGGYKGGPDETGAVEIGYGVATAYRGHGYATQAAQGMVDFAFTHDTVRLVCAHTLPEANASTHVLTKVGMRHVGSVIDPDDGEVWRWEMSRP